MGVPPTDPPLASRPPRPVARAEAARECGLPFGPTWVHLAGVCVHHWLDGVGLPSGSEQGTPSPNSAIPVLRDLGRRLKLSYL